MRGLNPDWDRFLDAIAPAPQPPTATRGRAAGGPVPPKIRRPAQRSLLERVKDGIRKFLADVLPDPPEAISADEIPVTFSVSAIGDNEVFKAQTRQVEIIELYVSFAAGPNTLVVKRGGIVLYESQAYPKSGFLSTPPFELLPGQNIVLNLTAATTAVGRIRYVIEEPFRHIEGKS